MDRMDLGLVERFSRKQNASWSKGAWRAAVICTQGQAKECAASKMLRSHRMSVWPAPSAGAALPLKLAMKNWEGSPLSPRAPVFHFNS